MISAETPGRRDLREDDYSAGPLADDKGRTLQWWVFGPVFRGVCFCKSFHIAEWDVEYPLKGR